MLSIIIGSLGALYQTRIKRLLAYSTIANVGFILMGIASGTIEGIEASITYTIIYMLTSLGIFTILLSIKKDNFKLKELQSLGEQNTIIAASLVILLFSTAGLPPLAGFLGKLEVIMAAISQSMYLLVIVAILMSVISTAYYIRLIQLMFFEKKEYVLGEIIVTRENILVLGVSLSFVMLLLLKAKWILEISHEIAISLIA
jgi:NADH-quinone oxidoreductase subunit N